MGTLSARPGLCLIGAIVAVALMTICTVASERFLAPNDGILMPDIIPPGPFNRPDCSELRPTTSAAAVISGSVLLTADKYERKPVLRC
jgi:subtilisin family serine protease